MRRQVIAADRYCRGPGITTRRPADQCELDHVKPWASDEDGTPTGGPTSGTNLAALSLRAHKRKTRRELDVISNHRRDLTWSTLLAQTVRTRSHDYRQYTARGATGHVCDTTVRTARSYRGAAQAQLGALRKGWEYHEGRDQADGTDDSQDRDFLRDLAARALYAALVHRGTDAFLAELDDYPGATDHGGPLAGWMFITHTHPTTGTRRHGPPANHPTPEEVLGLPDPDNHHHEVDEREEENGTGAAGSTKAEGSKDDNEGPGRGGATDADGDADNHRGTRNPWDRRRDDEPPPF